MCYYIKQAQEGYVLRKISEIIMTLFEPPFFLAHIVPL